MSITSPALKRARGDVPFAIVNYAGFLLFALLCAYPFYFLIINSVSANDMSALGQVRLWPEGLHLSNYAQILQLDGLSAAAIVSVARTVIGTACTVLASAFLGFMFTQERMWKRSLWYRLVIFTMYFSAGLIPMYITMKTLGGLTNSFWVYILPAIVQPFNIILVKTYVESMPASLQEAAEIDGAGGTLRVFFRIILPNMTPILATVAIFTAVAQWNSFQDTLLYITDQKLYSLQYLLYTYTNQASSLAQAAQNAQGGNLGGALATAATTQTPTSIRMTVAVLVVLPHPLHLPALPTLFRQGNHARRGQGLTVPRRTHEGVS